MKSAVFQCINNISVPFVSCKMRKHSSLCHYASSENAEECICVDVAIPQITTGTFRMVTDTIVSVAVDAKLELIAVLVSNETYLNEEYFEDKVGKKNNFRPNNIKSCGSAQNTIAKIGIIVML